MDARAAARSRGALMSYVGDHNSATYSRDGLEQALDAIARIPSVRSIHLGPPSMGNWIAMETLRQAKLGNRSPFLGKLGAVALFSPDLDVDVFKTQLGVVGPLKTPND